MRALRRVLVGDDDFVRSFAIADFDTSFDGSSEDDDAVVDDFVSSAATAVADLLMPNVCACASDAPIDGGDSSFGAAATGVGDVIAVITTTRSSAIAIGTMRSLMFLQRKKTKKKHKSTADCRRYLAQPRVQ